jgi:hypothetical protein
MRTGFAIILVLLICFPFGAAKGQNKFEQQLVRMIGKKFFAIAPENEETHSEVVFVLGNVTGRQLSIFKPTNSSYTKLIEQAIKDVGIKKLVNDSIKENFLMPLVFLSINEKPKELKMDDLVWTKEAIDHLLSVYDIFARTDMKNNYRLTEIKKITVYTNDRKE